MCITCNDTKTVNLLVNTDPTRTLSTRVRFVKDVEKRFKALRKVVADRIESGALLKRDDIGFTINTTAAEWRSKYDPDKIPEFMEWLEEQNNNFILSKGGKGIQTFPTQTTPIFPGRASFDTKTQTTTRVLGGVEGRWTDVHIRSAYQKGVQRARLELRKGGVDIPTFESTSEGIGGIFNAPFHVDRVQLAYSQTFTGMQGVTKAMEAPIARVLATGMAEGRNPRALALQIAGIKGEINKVGLSRARTLARTEVIRAHHGANIAEFRAFAIEDVIVKAEWLTAGDNRVCPRCDVMEGQIFKLDEIEPLIPLHPNCRCVAIPITPRNKKFGKPKGEDQSVRGFAGKLPPCLDTNEVRLTLNAPIACISKKDKIRALRAKKAFVPSTKAMQRLGKANEVSLAKLIKGESFITNEPFDVIVKAAGKRAHMIEVKTLIKTKTDKITMRKASRLRKLAEAAKHRGGQVHTVVFDARGKGRPKIFYSQGVGSFRLGGMRKVSQKELKGIFSSGRATSSPIRIKPIAKIKETTVGWKRVSSGKDFVPQMSKMTGKGLTLTGDKQAFVREFGNTLGRDFNRVFNDPKNKGLRAFAKKNPLKEFNFQRPHKIQYTGPSNSGVGSNLTNAFYDESKKSIHTGMKGYNTSNTLRLSEDVFNVTGNDFAGMVRHEYGHHILENGGKKFTDAYYRVWSKYENQMRISDYGTANYREQFAEAWAAFTSPKYATTPALRLHSGIEKLFTKFIQGEGGFGKEVVKKIVKKVPKVKKIKSTVGGWKKISTKKEFEKGMSSLLGKNFKVKGLSSGAEDVFIKKYANDVGESLTNMAKGHGKLEKLMKKKTLKSFVFDDADKVKWVQYTGDRAKKVDAFYKNKEITASLKGFSNRQQLKAGNGVFNVTGNDFAGMIRHEYGHHIYNSIPQSTQDKFIDIFINENTRGVSKYADTNVLELFAESFAAFTSPSFSKVKSKIPSSIEKFLVNLFD